MWWDRAGEVAEDGPWSEGTVAPSGLQAKQFFFLGMIITDSWGGSYFYLFLPCSFGKASAAGTGRNHSIPKFQICKSGRPLPEPLIFWLLSYLCFL